MSTDTITKGKVVSLTYSISDEAGKVLEQVDVPVDYHHGGNSGLFEKVEQALDGHRVGDEVEVTLTPAEGFGERDEAKTFTDVIENVPPQYREIGAEAEFVNDVGESLKMVVTHVDKGTVTLDGNHPFAGKTVIFKVNVNAMRDATPEEQRNGDVLSPNAMLH